MGRREAMIAQLVASRKPVSSYETARSSGDDLHDSPRTMLITISRELCCPGNAVD
jgi:hypothetical protein